MLQEPSAHMSSSLVYDVYYYFVNIIITVIVIVKIEYGVPFKRLLSHIQGGFDVMKLYYHPSRCYKYL